MKSLNPIQIKVSVVGTKSIQDDVSDVNVARMVIISAIQSLSKSLLDEEKMQQFFDNDIKDKIVYDND